MCLPTVFIRKKIEFTGIKKKKRKKHRCHTLGLLKTHDFLVHLLQNTKRFAFVIYDKSA